MPLDGVLLYKVTQEIKKIEGKHLRQIYQPTSVDYYFLFRSSTVRVCLKPDVSHISLAEKEKASEKMPSSFTMLLRKELKGAKLLKVEQIGMDRSIRFLFEKFDEIEGVVRKELFVEIMGMHSNMILVKDGRIADAHKKIVTRRREILPGKDFSIFPSGKISIFDLKELPGESEKSVRNVLLSTLEGFSPTSVEEVIHRAGYDPDVPWKDVKHERILGVLEEVKKELEIPGVFVYYEKGHPVEVSAFRLTMLNLKERYFERLSEGINEFVRWKEEKSTFENTKNRLTRVIMKRIEDLEDLEEKLMKEIAEVEKAEEYKKIGDLIVQNLWNIKGKSGEVELTDWETNEKIVVDVGKDPTRTAQKLYNAYKKLLRKGEQLKKRIEEIQKEKEYLYQLWQTIEDAEDTGTLEEIEEEMREVGLLKEKKEEKKEKRKSHFRETNYMGFKILVGRNNRQNDELVRNSSKEDLWFHAHEMPGAHVVVKTNGRKIPEEVIEYAASLAAGYSKGKNSGKVPVDYTFIKYVRKPKGFKPGMVIYTNYKTIFVEPRRIEG
ncbi:NFACT family protein [Thermotoga sp. SG1]|uniref:Rqc2 family fibronectin-binding protein n=1 Tax=Thermotoga sp. SG1 TaxID=126739 RepID=UPI000C77218B|nr:NFACT family protein [Thermotoga sp. SG1]PLV57372.1 fibronectin-binding protein [Thermotoga sp. SG1]